MKSLTPTPARRGQAKIKRYFEKGMNKKSVGHLYKSWVDFSLRSK